MILVYNIHGKIMSGKPSTGGKFPAEHVINGRENVFISADYCSEKFYEKKFKKKNCMIACLYVEFYGDIYLLWSAINSLIALFLTNQNG